MSPNQGDTAPFRFSTDDVPARDRLAVWREVLGRVHLHLDVEQIDDIPIRATVEQHSWSTASLYFSNTNAVAASRTPDLLRDGNGDFRLLWAEGSCYQFVSNDIVEDLDSNEAMLLFSGAVGTVRYLGTHRVTSVRIRRDRLAAVVHRLEDQPVRRVASSSPLRLLAGYTATLRREGPSANPLLAHRVAHHLIDLVALALNPTEETCARAATGAVRDARLATIRADVLANLAHTRLSAKTVAKRHGVTDRYVHLLFEETGATFGRFVLDERLKRAFRMLIDPQHAKIRVSDIAAAAGFSELSTFNRAFRRRFGDTPRGVRRTRRDDLPD
jgi:AraC-like DNA-binding protein